jgi:hypothetical protein
MDDEPLSSDDLAAITQGIEAIQHGDFVTLEQYQSERDS